MLPKSQGIGGKSGFYNIYRPPTKLREANVFTGVCHSVHEGWGVGISGTRSLLGDKYPEG